jgi:hypothetical protein
MYSRGTRYAARHNGSTRRRGLKDTILIERILRLAGSSRGLAKDEFAGTPTSRFPSETQLLRRPVEPAVISGHSGLSVAYPLTLKADIAGCYRDVRYVREADNLPLDRLGK